MSTPFITPWVDVVALALCIAFLAYVLAILLPFLRQHPVRTGDPQQLDWHVLVPCLDEEAVAARTVTRMREAHPSVHLWCIDDDSADRTREILLGLAEHDPQVHVVLRDAPHARQGKGAALNAGWEAIRARLRAEHGDAYDAAAERVVVGVLDADGLLDPRGLQVISGADAFGDPEVGAVQVQVRMINRGIEGRLDAQDPAPEGRFAALLVTLQDLEFRTVIAAMQHLRRRIGSVGMGGNGQFTRLAVLDRIAEEHGTPWHGALLEDFELGLHVLLVGQRNQYCNDTWVAQEGLPSVDALVRQRTRWAQGSMQCLQYLPAVLGSRRLSTAAAMEICYFLLIPWTQILGTLVFGAAGALVAAYALTDPAGPGHWFSGGAWGLIPLVLAFGIAPLALWGPVYRIWAEPGLTRGRGVLLGIAYWLYSYLMILSVWRAAFRLARSRSDWVKTERVYQELPTASPAGRLPSPSEPGGADRTPDRSAIPRMEKR